IAAALAALGKDDDVWPLLIHTPTPTVRSFLIERLATAGIHPNLLKRRLDGETNISSRRALILSLGNFPAGRAPALVPYLADLDEKDPDSGIHGAAGWVLRKWERQEVLDRIDREYAGRPPGDRRWYVSKAGPTFGVIEWPGLNTPG